MVVIHNTGIRLINHWINNDNITAVIYAHLPGQDTGGALVDIMYSKQSPLGRLPYTVAKKASNYGNLLNPVVPEGDLNLWYPQDNFTKGVYIDYRAFEANNITPQFEFSFSLTYTNFSYSDLDVALVLGANTEYLPPGSEIAEGGIPSLSDVVATVNCTVANTSAVEAAEVAQLYVSILSRPVKQLRFDKQTIKLKKKEHFSFNLTHQDLSTWDVERQAWGLQSGSYPIYVGKSVLDIQLTGTLQI